MRWSGKRIISSTVSMIQGRRIGKTNLDNPNKPIRTCVCESVHVCMYVSVCLFVCAFEYVRCFSFFDFFCFFFLFKVNCSLINVIITVRKELSKNSHTSEMKK
jgi:hypothetical protein